MKAGWWTCPNFILSKYYRGLEIFNCPHFEVCQWTGLLDKDGREIYEGDIIHLQSGREMIRENFLVEYSQRGAAFEFKGTKFNFSESDRVYGSLTVVGNKFENPELLA